MSETPERIGLISDGFGNWALAHRDEVDTAVHYIRADLAPSPAPDVRELEWRDSYGVWRAETPFGDYMVTGKIVKMPLTSRAEMVCEDTEADKAAAQADYRARILSALQPTQITEVMVQRAAEAMHKEMCGCWKDECPRMETYLKAVRATLRAALNREKDDE